MFCLCVFIFSFWSKSFFRFFGSSSPIFFLLFWCWCRCCCCCYRPSILRLLYRNKWLYRIFGYALQRSLFIYLIWMLGLFSVKRKTSVFFKMIHWDTSWKSTAHLSVCFLSNKGKRAHHNGRTRMDVCWNIFEYGYL